MQLESVRALKQELYEPLVERAGLRPQEAPPVSVPAERAADVAPAQPGIALGIAASLSSGDYRLAVRIQHRDFVDSRRLAAIEKAAHGEVDIRYIGQLTKQAEAPERRQRPLQIGGSIGHYAITAGTVGTFVRLDGEDGPRVLSNNHVLADENRGSVGDQILQPGQFDGGRLDVDRVGALERFIALNPSVVNEVDAALAVLDEDIEVRSEIEGIGAIAGLADLEDVKDVAKLGRTTGLTHGTVTAIEVDNVVVQFSTGALRFDGQIEISGADGQPFSKPGDSGSLIVETSTSRGVGLLFAGSDQGGPQGLGVTYANPLATVFGLLKIAGLW